jgi:flagellar L-ring protein precursor FlgH
VKSKICAVGLLLAISLALAACGRAAPPKKMDIPEPLEEGLQAAPQPRSAGSLYSRASDSLFADLKARQVGDMLTVLIEEKDSASKEASTSTDRNSSVSAALPHLLGLENSKLVSELPGNPDLNTLLGADFSNSFAGNGSTSRKGQLNASLAVQVIGAYPNGNLKIRGGKEVMVNSEVQVIYLTGIVRPVDISAANTVQSTKILNARISYTGDGALSDKQEPGWLMRIVDNVWPF